MSERIPGETIRLFDILRAERTAIKTRLGLPIIYKDMRFSLTPEGKKQADLRYITYFIKERDGDAQNARLGAKLYYRYLQLCYLPELLYVNKHIGTKTANNYMSHWGYMLSMNPSFVELVNGTDVNSALFAVENLN